LFEITFNKKELVLVRVNDDNPEEFPIRPLPVINQVWFQLLQLGACVILCVTISFICRTRFASDPIWCWCHVTKGLSPSASLFGIRFMAGASYSW